jgi:hypothetical protein
MSTDASSQKLVLTLRRILRAEETGVHVRPRAHNTVVVSNIDTWFPSFTDELHASHPYAQLVFTAATGDGIKVVVTQNRPLSDICNLIFLLLCFMSSFAVLVFSIGATFDDHFVTPNPWMQPGARNATASFNTRYLLPFVHARTMHAHMQSALTPFYVPRSNATTAGTQPQCLHTRIR